MIIAKISFAENLSQNKQNFYLWKLKKNTKHILKLKLISNNLKMRDEKIRLRYLENHIRKYYNVNEDIYNILNTIIDKIKYSLDKQYLVIDDFSIIDKTYVSTLAKIIFYGDATTKGSSLLKNSLVEAFNLLKVQNMLIKWGI